MTEPSTRVGVVGLGMMGAGIACSLLDAGLDVVVTDRDIAARDRDPRFGACWRDSVADLSRAVDVVVVVVVDAHQTSEVILGSNGIVDSGTTPIVISCATLSVDEVRAIAESASEGDLVLLDVGIAGGPDAAATGDLVTTVGGPPDSVEACSTILGAMSREVIHAGPVGAGMELKLIKNAISFMTMNAVHEGLLLAERLGYGSDLVTRICRETNLVDHFFWFPMSRASALPLAEDAPAVMRASAEHFADIAVKDLTAAAELGDAAGIDHPTIDLARDLARNYFLLEDSAR